MQGTTPHLTPVPGAEPRYDDDGRELMNVATCGACGHSWNDAAVSAVTPTPAGRCPFEYDHELEDVEYADEEETGQLAVGVPGEQRAIPGLAKEGKPAEWENMRGDGILATPPTRTIVNTLGESSEYFDA